MKLRSFVLSFALVSMLVGYSNVASAWWYHRPYPYPYHWYRPYWRCSPEMTQSSTSVVQKILSDAAASPSFDASPNFKEFVANTSSMANPADKLHAYLGAVGVDSTDANAVAQFMGARDHSTYVAAAEKNLSLTEAQADQLVQGVTAALLNLTTGKAN